MPVAPVGNRQLAWVSSGVHSPSWPAGTAVGHVVVAWCDWELRRGPLGPRQSGWQSTGGDVWWRKLDAAAFAAGPGQWDGRLLGMASVSGARGLGGRWTTDRGIQLSEAGAGMLVIGWTSRWEDSGLPFPASGMLGTDIEIADEQWVAWWLRTYATAGTQRIERDGDAEGYRAFEILPAKAPNPPVVASPLEGAHFDVALDVPVSIVHQSVSGLPQEARRIRVKATSTGTWSYLAADGTVNAAVQSVTTSSGVASIDAGQLAAGSYHVSAATMEGGEWSDWSPSRLFTLEVAPTVAPTLTTTHNDLTPVGSWTRTTPGGVQTAWQAAVVPQGGALGEALAVTPVFAGTGSNWSIPALDWVKDGFYELLVRIEQTGGLWSQWTRSAADQITWTAPSAPASATFVDGGPAAVSVAGIPATSLAVSVEWASEAVEDWSLLAMVDGPISTTVVPVPLAPYGVGRRYRARSWEAIDGVWLPSAYVTSAVGVSTDLNAYFVSDDGTESLQVLQLSAGRTAVVQGIAVSYGLMPDGAGVEARPAVDRTPTAGRAGSMILQTRSQAARAALVEWVTTRDAWWWRPTPTRDDDGVLRNVEPLRIALATQAGWSQVEQLNLAIDDLTIDWVEQ